jgi:hypothetical protein
MNASATSQFHSCCVSARVFGSGFEIEIFVLTNKQEIENAGRPARPDFGAMVRNGDREIVRLHHNATDRLPSRRVLIGA